jgi:hypothetical protein
MREPGFDDATLALKLYDLRRERELRKARRMLGDLPFAGWDEVKATMDYEHKENAHFRQATSYWEMCASFVNRKIFHPDVFLDTCGEGLFVYTAFKPWLAKIREQNPRFMQQTERAVNEHPALKERCDMMGKQMAAWHAEAAAEVAKKAAKKKDKKHKK